VIRALRAIREPGTGDSWCGIALIPAAPSATSRSIGSASSAVSRRSGSLTSSPSITGPSGPGRAGGSGGSVINAVSEPIMVSRWNGARPSTAAYSVAPNDHMSVDAPAAAPRSRSGAR
jgi:hypothetical protein